MKVPTAPIRFLLLVVGGWIGFRVVALLPGSAQGDGVVAGNAAPSSGEANAPSAQAYATRQRVTGFDPPPRAAFAGLSLTAEPTSIRGVRLAYVFGEERVGLEPPSVHPPAPLSPASTKPAAAAALPYPPFIPLDPAPTIATRRQDRWSASAWLFLRDDSGAGLAPGGILGGSQVGARVAYRLDDDARRPVSLIGRLNLPVDRTRGAEAAVGLDWRPLATVPVHILAERRQRLGRDGRSDFGLTVYGGLERRALSGRVRFAAYGQAGIVGIEERDLFADGSASASVRAGRVDVGVGAWGGAQPGVSRLDIGPRASVRLSVGEANLRASAEYRFRIAGDAAPASGPALTVATDF